MNSPRVKERLPVTSRASGQIDTETQALCAAVHSRFAEASDQAAAVRLDHALRREIIAVRGQLDVREPLSLCVRKQQLQRAGRVTASAFPRDYRVADVAETVFRKRHRARLPPESNTAAELAVPDPQREPGQPRDGRTVRKRDVGAGRLAVDLPGNEVDGIGGDLREMLLCGFRPEVVRRPVPLQGVNIAWQIVSVGPDKFHHMNAGRGWTSGSSLNGAARSKMPPCDAQYYPPWRWRPRLELSRHSHRRPVRPPPRRT